MKNSTGFTLPCLKRNGVKRMARTGILFIVGLLLLLAPGAAESQGLIQMPGLIDLRTTYSDGELDVEGLVRLAKERGFGVVIINDHDRMAMEYGLFPLRHILKKRVERNSINKMGARLYLEEIGRVQRKYPDVILIPGSETAPFYYWTGSYFRGDLTAHDHEKRLLTIGMNRAEDYEHLPILHNGFSTRYVKRSLPKIALFLIPLALGVYLAAWPGFYRYCGIGICVISILLLVNTDPFRSSPFDSYHGNQGIAPYQLVIDYVSSRGGLSFWNYPETRSGVRNLGPIRVSTQPYPEVLEQSKGYTGFAALYGDTITTTEPGNIWDRVLLAYCGGKRERPVWGISTADFHKEGEAGELLGNFPTVFLVPERTREAILFAMRNGKMYACRGKYPQRIICNEFSVSSPGDTVKGVQGDEILLGARPRVHIDLSLKVPEKNRVKVRLIRSGSVIKSFEGSLPMNIVYEDTYFEPGTKIYYRMDVRGHGSLVSNPIFVKFK